LLEFGPLRTVVEVCKSSNALVSFNVVSIFTNIPVDEAIQVIRHKLQNDDTLAGRSVLGVEATMDLLEVCLETTYFQVDDKFFQNTKMAWL
jgi:hypothetical protein